MKLKIFLIKICFWIIDKCLDESNIVEPDPEIEKLIDELTKDVNIDAEEYTKEIKTTKWIQNEK